MALDYPNRPVKILVGFSAGGAVDVVARLIGDWLSRRLGGQFLVEDKPGAANNIATEDMIRSPADGYTLLLTNPTNAINATFYKHLNYDFLRDSDPVASIMRVPNVMVVGAAVPAHTIPEFIAYAKANTGKVYYASPGNGTSPHMSSELFKMMTHVQLLQHHLSGHERRRLYRPAERPSAGRVRQSAGLDRLYTRRSISCARRHYRRAFGRAAGRAVHFRISPRL